MLKIQKRSLIAPIYEAFLAQNVAIYQRNARTLDASRFGEVINGGIVGCGGPLDLIAQNSFGANSIRNCRQSSHSCPPGTSFVSIGIPCAFSQLEKPR